MRMMRASLGVVVVGAEAGAQDAHEPPDCGETCGS